MAATRKNRTKVGVIGLGIIGSRVAAGLRGAGHQVYVWSRSPHSAPNFLGSVVEVADLCDVLQVFVSDDQHLDSDVVFGVTSHLVGDFRRPGPEESPPEPGVEAPWYSLHYDFVMEPGEAKLPHPPIA